MPSIFHILEGSVLNFFHPSRDGLANRLQRVLNRQRSSARIWQFKRSKQSRTRTSSTIDNQDQSSSTLLIVDRTWNEYSHAIVQGHVHNG